MRPSVLTLSTLLGSSLAITAPAADPLWPAFRGANAAGTSTTARPPTRIGPDSGVRWKIKVPASPSSPCIAGDRIFLTTHDNRRLETRAYQRSDGKLLWTRVAPAPQLEAFHDTEGSPAAGTPSTDGTRVVSYFGSAGLFCHDLDGRELWRRPLPMVRTAGNFGSGTSPLLAGGLVILNRDQTVDSALAAFDLATGEPAWLTPRIENLTSYGTPILWGDGPNAQIVLAGALTVKGYSLKNGAEQWAVRGLPSFTCTTPVVGDGLLFFAGWSPGKADSPFPSWESTVEKQDKNSDGILTIDEFAAGPAWFKAQDINNDGKIERADWDAISGLMKRGENVLLAIKPGGRGEITDTHVAWKQTRGLPYVPSPLYYDGRIYLIRDGGMASSFDAKTGRVFYQQERINAIGSYYASPVAADGRIYVASLTGTLTVLKAGGDKPEILHQVNFGERIAATPALVGEHLYLRTDSHLYAFGP